MAGRLYGAIRERWGTTELLPGAVASALTVTAIWFGLVTPYSTKRSFRASSAN